MNAARWLIPICTAFPVIAQESPYAFMQWRGPGDITIMRILILSTILAAAIIAYIFFRKRMKKKEVKEYYFTQFLKTAQHYELTPAEISRVKSLLAHSEIEEPEMILRYVQVFEICIEKEIDALLKKGITPVQQQRENDLLYGIRKKLSYHRLPDEQPLLSTRNITIGQYGSLYGRDHTRPLFKRAVVTDGNEFNFTIEASLDRDSPFSVRQGDSLKFVFTRKNDGMYGIVLPILSVFGRGGMIAGHTMELRRNQLRQHVRVEVALPVQVRLLHTVDLTKSFFKPGEQVSAKMVDISGGGLCFICEKRLQPSDAVSMTFDLPYGKMAGITGKILRIADQPGKTLNYYKHHIQFVQLEQRKRDMIVKFVFEKQRQLSQWR